MTTAAKFCLSQLNSYAPVGDIYIWDQESGALLRHVQPHSNGGDLTCVAWNHASENSFMFATGSHDGAVRIWTKRPGEDDEEPLDCSTVGARIARTNSPFPMLEHEGSESPLAKRDFDFRSS